MAESIGLWTVTNDGLKRIAPGQIDRESHLEDWIESHPDILGERLLIVDRQIRTHYGGILDLLAIDSEGRCVIIELKRGRTPRDIVAQALDYTSWVAELSDPDVRDLIARSHGHSFPEAYRGRFGDVNVPEQLNTDQRMLIVGTEVDDATTRIVEHITRKWGADINVVVLSYFVVGEQKILARTWIVDPIDLEERVDSRPSGPAAADLDRVWTGLWHVNVGIHDNDSVQRDWDDERHYGFLSAGQGPQWRDEMLKLSAGDTVYAYLNGAGYVGAGVNAGRKLTHLARVSPV